MLIHLVISISIYIRIVFTLIFPVFGGLLIAYYIRGLRFENVYKTILYTPFTISFVATGVIWTYIYGRDLGVLNGVLSLFDISKVNWLTDYQINNISFQFFNISQNEKRGKKRERKEALAIRFSLVLFVIYWYIIIYITV